MDSYVLTGPQGSAINVGSILRGDQVQDYGSVNLLQSTLSENTFVDGAVLSYEHAGARHWTFSVLLASGAIGALDDVARQLRQIARPGAFLDIQVDGIASANVVRWDVIAGRVEEAYDLAVQRAGRRKATIALDTQPYGYLPTWILLASAASVGNPGFLTIPGGSIIGDVPGFAELVISSASQTLFVAADPTYIPDAVLWSGANKTGGIAFWPAASLVDAGITGGALIADSFAPGSQARRSILTNAQGGWTGIGYVSIPSGLEASMRGRWRAFAFARMNSASQPYAALLAGDVVAGGNAAAAMGSAGPIATLPSPRYYGVGGANTPVPTGHILVDLGEVTIPPTGSGIDQDVRFRLWANASWPAGPATVGVDIGGVFLLDIDGPAGILPRGLSQPTTQSPTIGRFVTEAYYRRVLSAQATGGLSSVIPMADVLGLYRGQVPFAHPSQTRLDFYLGDHRYTRSYPIEVMADSPRAYWRLGDAAGAATAIDISGNANHLKINGLPSGWSFGASGMVLGDVTTGATKNPSAGLWNPAPVGIPTANQARTIEAIFKTFQATGDIISWGSIGASSALFRVALNSANQIIVDSAFVTPFTANVPQVNDGVPHHLAMAYNGTNMAVYFDGALVASGFLAAALTPGGVPTGVHIGERPDGLQGFAGAIDEVSIYGTALAADRILAHAQAARSGFGATSPPMHMNQVLAASYRYRPRFGFSRGL